MAYDGQHGIALEIGNTRILKTWAGVSSGLMTVSCPLVRHERTSFASLGSHLRLESHGTRSLI